jgi:hypothetical protein
VFLLVLSVLSPSDNSVALSDDDNDDDDDDDDNNNNNNNNNNNSLKDKYTSVYPVIFYTVKCCRSFFTPGIEHKVYNAKDTKKCSCSSF